MIAASRSWLTPDGRPGAVIEAGLAWAATGAAMAQVVDFTQDGRALKEPIKINDAIYQAVGFSNTFLVLTPAGNVVIDTSIAGMSAKHHDMLTKISAAPINQTSRR